MTSCNENKEWNFVYPAFLRLFYKVRAILNACISTCLYKSYVEEKHYWMYKLKTLNNIISYFIFCRFPYRIVILALTKSSV